MASARTVIPPFRHLVHRFSDPEQFGIAVSGARLTVDYLARQSESTRVEQFQSPAWALDFHEAQVKACVQGAIPPGWASIGMMRSAAPSSWYGTPGGAGVLACTPPGETIDGCFNPGFSCMAVNVPLAVWEQCRTVAGSECAFASGVVLRLPPPLYARLDRQICETRRLLRDAHRATVAERAGADLAAQIVTTAWEIADFRAAPRESLRNRARLARRAEAWMRGHLAEPIRIPDVCLALRVSRRELEYAFRTVFDQSPRDFLHSLRLNAVRRALRADPHASILDIALAHGVTHLSRFAANYRARFGENPSLTPRADFSRVRY